MSAMGETIAFASLGLSCQTSRQIDGLVPLLRRLTRDETIERVTLPFDWMISTTGGLRGMLLDRHFFPDDHMSLVDDQLRLRHRDYDVLYWHESRLLSRNGHPAFENARSKFAHTSARFEQIAKVPRVVAVYSNTQNNLPEIEDAHGLPLTQTDVADVQALRETFEAMLGRAVDLLIVSRNQLGEQPLPPNTAYYEMTPELSHWAGSRPEWGRVYRDYLTNA